MKKPSPVIDISLPLSPETPAVPGDPPFVRRLFLSQATDGCEAAALRFSAHSAAHIDFPAHFLPGGKRVGDYPVAAFFLPAVVIDCGETMRLGPDVLAGAAVAAGEAVLFKTVNSRLRCFAGPDFPGDFAAATPELARELVARNIGLVGIDAMSIEPLDDPAYPVHQLLLAAGILILEGLTLATARPGRYRLVCLPLAMADAEASPVRAVLLDEAGEPAD
ncbi:cyclase family protein [Desulfovibrio sp. TomC]|uniref:cyclase family protein n=1 Tax=Desulfovibrio sp. TomC TaxID=1562888 RepID=UPI0005735E48|nr:cyclase family protein [Desulfovibrio sp. TomC]KHK04235.1 Metal-dependent hydrolase [Desulfovibrio sp. TomC]